MIITVHGLMNFVRVSSDFMHLIVFICCAAIAPSVPPNITRVETVNATSLQIKFTIPPNDTHNGILQGFKVMVIHKGFV